MGKILTLKGRKEGVMLCVTAGYDFDAFFKSFKELIGSENSFFVGGKIVGIEGIKLTEEQKEKFKEYIELTEGVELISFEYTEGLQEKPVFKRRRLYSKPAEKLAVSKPDLLENLLEEEDFMSDSLFFRGTVRSGVRLESEKNIIVIGDVNPGAELIAKSNIVVLGRLKGLAHAGADGSEDKIIAAWKLEPTQIRIADYITMPPDEEPEDMDYPEMACIEDGRVVIKSYQ